MALASDQDNVVGARLGNRGGNRGAAVADFTKSGGPGHDGGADRAWVFAAGIVVGDDGKISGARGDFAHLGPLADIAIPARTEHHDQPAAVGHVRAQRGNRGFERIGGVGIIDIGGRTGSIDRGAFKPPAHRLQARQRIENGRRRNPRCHRKAGRNQRIGGLIGTDQWQVDLAGVAVVLDRQHLPKLAGFARRKTQEVAALAHRAQVETACGRLRNRLGGPFRAVTCPKRSNVDHRRAAGRDHFGEQPHLGGEIGLHRAVVVEMIAAEIGEGTRHHVQPFIPELREAVARSLVGHMRDAFACQPAHIGQEGDDIGRGETGGDRTVSRGDTQSADTRRALARHAPDLAGHLDGRGLAVGAGDRNDGGGHGAEEPRRQLREGPARLGILDVERAFDPRLGPRDDGNRTGFDRRRNEVLAVEPLARKGAEHGSGGNLAVIDGKAGDAEVLRAVSCKTTPHQQIGKAHQCLSTR